MGSLEQIIRDPTKYNYTKDLIDKELAKQQKAELLKKKMSRNLSAKNLNEYAATQKKVIGSKYRFIEYQD